MKQRIPLLLALLLSASALVHCLKAQSIQQKPLIEALNADGTLKEGINGSFNAQGFSMRYGAKGEPMFVQSSQTEVWEGFGSAPGLPSSVIALAVSGSDVHCHKENALGEINVTVADSLLSEPRNKLAQRNRIKTKLYQNKLC
jgi:hypothetical protein